MPKAMHETFARWEAVSRKRTEERERRASKMWGHYGDYYSIDLLEDKVNAITAGRT